MLVVRSLDCVGQLRRVVRRRARALRALPRGPVVILYVCPICDGESEEETIHPGVEEVVTEVCSGCAEIVEQERGWCP